MRSKRRIARAAVLAALGGCTGTTIDGGTSRDAPVQVDVAARCAAPHGGMEIPATASSFARALAGRWLVCGHDPSASSLFVARDGLDFSVDGHWSLLKADGLGGFQQTVNDGTFGTYVLHVQGTGRPIPPTDSTPAGGLTLHLNGSTLGDLQVGFEVSPRRLVTHEPAEVDFVRLDNEADEPVPYTSKEGEVCSATTPCRAGLAPATLGNDAGTSSLCIRVP